MEKLNKNILESFVIETCGRIIEKANEAFKAQANFNGVRRLYPVR
jgi:hypothetical protein